MNTKKFAWRLKRFRGMYKIIAEETGVPYSTVRKLASGGLPNPGIAITEPIENWMKGRKP